MTDKQTADQLGQRVSEALGSPLDDERRVAQEDALVALMGRPRRPAARMRRPLGFGLAGAAAAALVAVVWLGGGDRPVTTPPSTAQTFRVKGQTGPAEVGLWLSSVPGQPAQVDFAGGSRFTLTEHGLAQVAEASESQVTLRLDHGHLAAKVRRQGDTAWHVTAGPYRVTVLGTRFTVVWDAKSTLLAVTVTRGRVLVSGTGLSTGGIVVDAGRRLRIHRRRGQLSLKTVAARPAAPMAVVVERRTTPQGPEPAAPNVATLEPSRPTIKGPAASAWKVALKSGRYADAVTAAERAGFAGLMSSLPAADLWQLSRACRYARKGRRATEAFRAYRKRFPGSARARRAAFLIGRVQMDLRGRPAAASRWFDTYLKESPRGPLAEEALGRFIDAAAKAGRHRAASAAAKRYLKRYKSGIFKNLAQSVLRRSGKR